MNRNISFNFNHDAIAHPWQQDHTGFRDPIAEGMRSRWIAKAAETLNATFGRFLWDRGGSSNGEADPRVDVAEACGWPKRFDLMLLNDLFLHDAVAARVVEFMAKQAWQVQPRLMEGDKVEGTPLLDSWAALNDVLRGGELGGYRPQKEHALFSELEAVDVLGGVGRYGALYLAIDDGEDPSKPAAGVEEEGSRPVSKDRGEENEGAASPVQTRNLVAANGSGPARTPWRLTVNLAKTKGRQLLSATPLPEVLATVVAWETNDRSPRNGMPALYQIQQIDPTMTWSGSTPPLKSIYVHWTRVVHIVDRVSHTSSTKSLGLPRMQVVLPEILDGRKISGADGLACWLNAMLKIFLETHPSLGGDVPLNRQQASDDFENMMWGGQQWMFLGGMHANPVAPALTDPTPHQAAKIERICIKFGWPVPVFKGYEIGEQASDNNSVYHQENVRQHQKNHESQSVIAPTVDRLVMLGVLQPWGKEGYWLNWPDVGSQDPLKKAQVFATRMQAFAAASQQQLLDEEDVLVREAGFTPEDAEKIAEKMEERIAEEEEAAQAMADEEGFEKAPPEGFEKPQEDQPFPPQKLRPGEKLVMPPKA